MKLKKRIVGIALMAALGGAGWWYWGHGAPTADKAEAAADDASVLIKSAPVQRQALPLTMNVFGEVAPGKVEAIGFPQAGQLTQLGALPGQQLKRGEMIATLSTDPAAQMAYAQALTALAFAQRELRRNQDLLGLQLATQAQADVAARQLQDAQAGLAAQAKLGGGQGSARLLAPFDGVVTAVPVGQGDRLQAGAAVVQLGRSDTLRVQLAIEPAQSGLLRVGMPVAISAVQDSTRKVSAVITQVQSLVDPKTQMVTAIVVLPAGKQAGLLAGMRVQASIELGQRLAWSVPRQAVLSDDKGAYLFQVVKGRARRVEVSKLLETATLFGIDGKLDPLLPVVVLGNYELQDGMAVREGAP